MTRAVRSGLFALALAVGFLSLLGALLGPIVIVAAGLISGWWIIPAIAWLVFCVGALAATSPDG